MRISFLIFIIPVISLLSLFSSAQITPGSADYVDLTEYAVAGKKDSVFVFNINNSDPYLEALSPTGADVDFVWAKYNPQTQVWVNFSTERSTLSKVSGFNDSTTGFRLNIEGGYESYFWVIKNDFTVTITSTDEEKKIKDANILCGSIDLISAKIDGPVKFYYNREDHTVIDYAVNYQVSINDWYPNPDPDYTMNNFQKLDNSNLKVAVDKPHWEDTWYVLEVEDKFGLIRKDSAFHESNQPHADFSKPEYIPLDDINFYPDKSERYYEIYGEEYDAISAPAQFMFINKSLNADNHSWFFGDDSVSGTLGDTILHTYLLPGTYYPKIVVSTILPLTINPCVDTFPEYDEILSDPRDVVVDAPTVRGSEDLGQWPNVFTPPNGEIKYFRFTGDVSITNFEISIYNRYGKRVYKYTGNVRDWEGWNGKHKGAGNYVSSGVYYYVITEMYELPEFDPDPLFPQEPLNSEIKRGFFHVYNTE